MKIIFNKPKKEKERINNWIEKVKKVKEKIDTNEQKLSYKHYMLLFSMILIGVLSLALNIRENKKISKENYDTYTLSDDSIVTSSDKTQQQVEYITAMSSIYEEAEYIENMKNEEKIKINTNYVFPTKGIITKGYSSEELVLSNTLDMWMTHEGIDISGNLGDDVYAIEEGTIDSIYDDALYGKTIIISHGDNLTSVYCNLGNDIQVKEGENVKKGDKIGTVGDTAIIEVGDEPHIHVEILKNGIKINPEIIGLK